MESQNLSDLRKLLESLVEYREEPSFLKPDPGFSPTVLPKIKENFQNISSLSRETAQKILDSKTESERNSLVVYDSYEILRNVQFALEALKLSDVAESVGKAKDQALDAYKNNKWDTSVIQPLKQEKAEIDQPGSKAPIEAKA